MAVDTMFQPTGGGGSASSSGQYVQDNFLDTAVKATNNTGLSSTVSTNPLGFFFANTDSPTYAYKTLFIKDLVLIEDRSKWIDNKQTYEIVFNENNPNIRGYICGTPRIRNSAQGKCVEVRETGDFVGITGNIRQLAWLLNVTSQTGTCLRSTDGVSGSNLTFGSGAVAVEANGVNTYYPLLHQASAATFETDNIHDFRITANQFQTLRFVGVLALSDATNIAVKPGSTYVNKSLVTSSAGATFSVPGVSAMGAVNAVVKGADGTYSLNTENVSYLGTLATGFSGTNLVNVSVGTGSSFPVGTGIVAGTAPTLFIGVVENQSTDTLLISPTLPFGLNSNALYKAWAGSPTLAVSASLFSLNRTIDFTTQNNFVDSIGFNVGNSLLFAYSNPELKYRLWGRDVRISTVDQVAGLALGASSFIQFDGECSAAELEFHAQGIMHATMSVNGMANWGINTGFTGSFKRTVFTEGGPSWNSFVLSPGSSFSNVVLTKINLYDRLPPAGVSFGVIGEFQSYVNSVERSTVNATLMPIGGFQRVFADSLYLTGAWTRGFSGAFAGGVAYFGASTNCVATLNYFGSKFAFIGTAGASMVATVDGASIAYDFGILKGPTTVGFHTVTLQYQAGATAVLSAIDFIKPQTGEIVVDQNYTPLADLKNIPSIFTTQYTPQAAKDGDIWVQKKANVVNPLPTVWLKLFGQWSQLNINSVTDDPNATTLVRSHGSSTGGGTGAVQDVELFNLVSWTTGTSSTLGARANSSASDSAYAGNHTVIDGATAVPTVTLISNYFNKITWSSFTTRSTARSNSGSAAFNGFLYSNRGNTTANFAAGVATADKWNNAAWSTGTAWAGNASDGAYFVQGSIQYAAGYVNTSGTATNAVETRTAADGVGSGTAMPVAGGTKNGSSCGSLGLASNVAAVGTATTAAYFWNGSAWSAAITSSYSIIGEQGSGQASMGNGLAVKNGGNASSGASPQNTTNVFNGSVFVASTASALSRGLAVSSGV